MLSMSIAFAGFLMGLSLIVAIGPQNALIIRQGIKREGLIPILVVCILSDVILIFGGTAGVGALVDRAPHRTSSTEMARCSVLALFRIHLF